MVDRLNALQTQGPHADDKLLLQIEFQGSDWTQDQNECWERFCDAHFDDEYENAWWYESYCNILQGHIPRIPIHPHMLKVFNHYFASVWGRGPVLPEATVTRMTEVVVDICTAASAGEVVDVINHVSSYARFF
jgi:hypothetical protein